MEFGNERCFREPLSLSNIPLSRICPAFKGLQSLQILFNCSNLSRRWRYTFVESLQIHQFHSIQHQLLVTALVRRIGAGRDPAYHLSFRSLQMSRLCIDASIFGLHHFSSIVESIHLDASITSGTLILHVRQCESTNVHGVWIVDAASIYCRDFNLQPILLLPESYQGSIALSLRQSSTANHPE